MQNKQEQVQGQTIAIAILAGKKSAWDEFHSLYGGMLLNFASRIADSCDLQSEFSAEDVVNDFLAEKVLNCPEKMFGKIARGEGCLKPRLLTSLRNYGRDLHRRSGGVQSNTESQLIADTKTSQVTGDGLEEVTRQTRSLIDDQQQAIRSSFPTSSRIRGAPREILLLSERVLMAEKVAECFCRENASEDEKKQHLQMLVDFFPWENSEATTLIPERNEPLLNVWQYLAPQLFDPPFGVDGAIISTFLKMPRNTWYQWVKRARNRVIKHVGVSRCQELFPYWPKRLFLAIESPPTFRSQRGIK